MDVNLLPASTYLCIGLGMLAITATNLLTTTLTLMTVSFSGILAPADKVCIIIVAPAAPLAPISIFLCS